MVTMSPPILKNLVEWVYKLNPAYNRARKKVTHNVEKEGDEIKSLGFSQSA